MITGIASCDSVDHSWSPYGDYEHEAILESGEIVDLKADFLLESIVVKAASLVLMLTRLADGLAVDLKWLGLRRVEVSGGEMNLHGESDLGFIGARLLAPLPPGMLAFQIDTDDLRIRCSCESFMVSGSQR